MERLNYNHLFYFYIVAKEGSIKEAALKLHISQPTISDQIKNLEEFLGSSLFDRKNRSLRLTPDGVVLSEYAEKIFSLGYEATTLIRSGSRFQKNSLDLGIVSSIPQSTVYDWLDPIFSEGRLAINFKENDLHYLLADLEAGHLDIVITDTKEGLQSNFEAHRIGQQRTFVLAHKSLGKLKKGFPQSLDGKKFFNYSQNSALRFELEILFRKLEVNPVIIGESDDPEIHKRMGLEREAFIVLPEALAEPAINDTELVKVGELKALQTTLWGVINSSDRGQGYKLVSGKL